MTDAGDKFLETMSGIAEDIEFVQYPIVPLEKIGDRVAGIVVDVREIPYEGEKLPIMDVQDVERGEIVSVWLSTLLLKQTLLGQVLAGDSVYVELTGHVKTGNGKAKTFRIAHVTSGGLVKVGQPAVENGSRPVIDSTSARPRARKEKPAPESVPF